MGILCFSLRSNFLAMNSEFYNVALDRIRYSLVWEDSRTLYGALAINPPTTYWL